MVLDELLTPSEFKLVMDDIQNFSGNLVENSVQLFSDQPETSGTQTYDSDHSDSKLKRKRPKRMCDSTFENPPIENPPPPNFEMFPCLEPYSGAFDFHLQLPADSSAHRWTYSKALQKVFIDIDKVLALQFKWNYSELKPDSEFYVRAMPVFIAHDSLKIPVKRCPIHLLPDNVLNNGFSFVEHVMRCEHSSTVYAMDPASERLSCVTPLSRPQPGSDTTTLTYKFVCKTSCLGGMNRKPISIIFTLEDVMGTEFGRQLLAVKICSCPKRDKAKEEKNDLDKTQTCARLPSSSNANPSMICTRSNDIVSHPPADSLRDLKTISSATDSEASSSECRKTAGYAKGPTKAPGKVRMEKEEGPLKDINEKLDYLKDCAMRAENVDQSSNGKFGRYVTAVLNELPVEGAADLQNDIMTAIWQKKMQVIRGNNVANYCPTPEQSIASPCPPIHHDWQY